VIYGTGFDMADDVKRHVAALSIRWMKEVHSSGAEPFVRPLMPSLAVLPPAWTPGPISTSPRVRIHAEAVLSDGLGTDGCQPYNQSVRARSFMVGLSPV